MSSTMVDLGNGWENPEVTEIKGIVRVQKKGDTYAGGPPHTSDLYVVSFTATIEADNAEQAGDRAMQLRSWLVDQEWLREHNPAHEPTFYWHLHDHDGCQWPERPGRKGGRDGRAIPTVDVTAEYSEVERRRYHERIRRDREATPEEIKEMARRQGWRVSKEER